MFKNHSMSKLMLSIGLLLAPLTHASELIDIQNQGSTYQEPVISEVNDAVRTEDYMRLSEDELNDFIGSLSDEDNAIVREFLDLMLNTVSDSLNTDVASQFMDLLASRGLQPSISVNVSLLRTIDAALQAD